MERITIIENGRKLVVRLALADVLEALALQGKSYQTRRTAAGVVVTIRTPFA